MRQLFFIYQKNKSQSRKLHSVLTFKTESNRLGCINRDRNACLNMKKIFQYFIQTGERPLKYRRGYDLEKEANQLSNGFKPNDKPNINQDKVLV